MGSTTAGLLTRSVQQHPDDRLTASIVDRFRGRSLWLWQVQQQAPDIGKKQRWMCGQQSLKLLDYLVGTVEKHLLDGLRDPGDLIASAGLSLDFSQLLWRAAEEAE